MLTSRRLFAAAAAILLAPALLAEGVLHHPREAHLADVRQLTFGGENAEAYWSPDGQELIFQSTSPPYECDQIFRMRPDRPGEKTLVSTGKGRTTCAYFFYPQAERILYSSTHLAGDACPPRPDFSMGYVWALYDSYEIFTARPDGSDVGRLSDNAAYDAEATMCPLDGSIVFTSTRDGDLELYRMNADGSDVRRLTDAPGYDGGAFFSPDCSRIVWRASRPREGEELEDYRRLLDEGLIRPTKLELWVAEADGSEARQITYLDAASFAPFFHPSGERVLFSTNYGAASPREFDIWAVDADGTDLERITYAEGFDGFPMFSPDGKWLAFSSNRNQGKPGETDVYVARWIEDPPGEPTDEAATAAAGRFHDAVAWLADDAREGRGVGTEGLDQATAWLEERFAAIGLQGAGNSFRQAFEVAVRVEAGPATALAVDGDAVAAEGFVAASFSASGVAEGEVVPVGYGITAEEHRVDDYADREVTGKVVLVRRFTPSGPPFDDDGVRRRHSELRYKAWNAREHGAAGVVIVDLPEVKEGEEVPEEAALPRLDVDARGDAGLPVVVVKRELGQKLFAGAHHARVSVELESELRATHNVVGRLAAGADVKHEGPLVIGAHYDHLGLGGRGSLAPDSREPHNGADDNASGTAALLEIGRLLQERRSELGRDVYLVAFSGEESGLLGSTHFTREPPEGLAIAGVYAMLNLDMVGRLRGNVLTVLGADSADEWRGLVGAACDGVRLACSMSGDGYGPSDQTPFYAAGVPVLHFFTGTHEDYHKPSDDTEKINAAGGARVASLVADLAVTLSRREEPLTYMTVAPPPPQGDSRSFGASLGTIPDYAGDGRPGVLLAGTREESPAQQAGMRRGDLLVELAGHDVGDIYDFMFVLRQSKPGETVKAVVVRDGERVTLEVTFGESRGMR
ncbi:MAG TPA: M28 family peptidase [Thermoanaerobaculia bacterium]